MNPPPDVSPTTPAPELPHVPGSSSELLAASHVALVTLTAVGDAPWRPSNDGLEHRQLPLVLRLDRTIKGRLLQPPSTTIQVAVPQRREPGMMVSDFHGFWSHQTPVAGASHLLVAQGASSDLAQLVQEPAISALVDPGLAADADGATALDRQYAAALQPGLPPAGRAAAGVQLLRQVNDHRSRCHGLLGRYVLARIEPLFALNEQAFTNALLFIALQSDTDPSLRESLVYGAYAEMLQLGLTAERRRLLLRPLFELLLVPTAAPMIDRLLQVPIHNLLFEPEPAPLRVDEVLADASLRARLETVIGGQTGEKARKVGAWVKGSQ